MLLKVIAHQTKFLLKQKEALFTFVILLCLVMGNYVGNVLAFRGMDVAQMYQPMKLLSLSYNKRYFSADTMLLIVMIYPILVTLPAGFSYVKEQQTKEEIYLITRLGKKVYLLSKLGASFFTTMAVFSISFLVEIIMNCVSFPLSGLRDLSNLSIYNQEYAEMVSNYVSSAIYIYSPMLYAIIFTIFFGVISGLLGMLAVAISFSIPVKFRMLLFLPNFLLLNSTTYLNAVVSKGGISVNWYDYLLLFNDVKKSVWFLVLAVLILILGIITLYICGRKKEI